MRLSLRLFTMMTLGQWIDFQGERIAQLYQQLPASTKTTLLVAFLPVVALHLYLKLLYTPEAERAVSFAWEVPPEAQ